MPPRPLTMKPKPKPIIKSPNLSVSSVTTIGSSTSTLLSPRLSPRRAFLGSSPPPSPSLPSLIPRHGKKPPKNPLRQLRRLVLATCGLSLLLWLALSRLSPSTHPSPFLEAEYELVGADSLPDEPSAIVVVNERGKARWTVSVPRNASFPLRPGQYREICEQAGEIGRELRALGGKRERERERGYHERDPYFLDVREAQRKGLLPKDGDGDGEAEGGLPVCQKSLTYVMETADAGMGNTLLGMWMAYGLAVKEGRAFFVDDTRWAYGKYTTYFAPPPAPPCSPAPPHHRLSCPHSARHLVISASTFAHHFGRTFHTAFPHHSIFALARTGYEALFHLSSSADAAYVEHRVNTVFEEVHRGGGTTVGVHVRRGDGRPWEYAYAQDYLPLVTYMGAARSILESRYSHGAATEGAEDVGVLRLAADPTQDPTDESKVRLLPRDEAPGFMASAVFLASDDPDIYAAPEVVRAQRAQDRIVLASKTQLEAQLLSAGGGRAKGSPWVDQIHGWEGGFFASQFWGLGMPDSNIINNEKDLHEKESRRKATESGVWVVSKEAMQMRELVGRAYLLDLAVLGKADAVVCAVSSAACRMLAVMMGHERAIEKGLWKNVDGGYPWQGLVVDEDG